MILRTHLHSLSPGAMLALKQKKLLEKNIEQLETRIFELEEADVIKSANLATSILSKNRTAVDRSSPCGCLRANTFVAEMTVGIFPTQTQGCGRCPGYV